MSFESKSTNDLMRIVMSGGGIILGAADRPIDDLLRIATAAAGSGAHVVIRNLEHRATEDLARIAVAGRGCVLLEG